MMSLLLLGLEVVLPEPLRSRMTQLFVCRWKFEEITRRNCSGS